MSKDISILAENYKRLFGEIPANDDMDRKVQLTEGKKPNLSPEQLTKWVNIHKKYSSSNNETVLEMKSGNIYLNNFLVESADKFLQRDSYQMVETLNSNHRKTLLG